MNDGDRSRLDPAVSALEDALRGDNEQRIRSASDDLDRILRSAGAYVSSPEGENDDGAYDV